MKLNFSQGATRQLVLNANGTCAGCARLPKVVGSIGIVEGVTTSTSPTSPTVDGEGAYECTPTAGKCGVTPALWPDGTERGLPDWYTAHARKMALAARSG